MGLFGKTGAIRRRVILTIEDRIAVGEQEYEEECRKEDERLADGVRTLTDACANAKLAAEHRIVNSIIG